MSGSRNESLFPPPRGLPLSSPQKPFIPDVVGRKIQWLLLLLHAERGCPLDKLAEEYSDFYDEDLVPIKCKTEDLKWLCGTIPDCFAYLEKQGGFMYIKARSLRRGEAKKVIGEFVLPYVQKQSSKSDFNVRRCLFPEAFFHPQNSPFLSPANTVETDGGMDSALPDDLLDIDLLDNFESPGGLSPLFRRDQQGIEPNSVANYLGIGSLGSVGSLGSIYTGFQEGRVQAGDSREQFAASTDMTKGSSQEQTQGMEVEVPGNGSSENVQTGLDDNLLDESEGEVRTQFTGSADETANAGRINTESGSNAATNCDNSSLVLTDESCRDVEDEPVRAISSWGEAYHEIDVIDPRTSNSARTSIVASPEMDCISPTTSPYSQSSTPSRSKSDRRKASKRQSVVLQTSEYLGVPKSRSLRRTESTQIVNEAEVGDQNNSIMENLSLNLIPSCSSPRVDSPHHRVNPSENNICANNTPDGEPSNSIVAGVPLAANSDSRSEMGKSSLPQENLHNTEGPISSSETETTAESILPPGTASQRLSHNNDDAADELDRRDSTPCEEDGGETSSDDETSSFVPSCKEFALANELDKLLNKKEKCLRRLNGRITFRDEITNPYNWTCVISNGSNNRFFFMCPPEDGCCSTFKGVRENWILVPNLYLPQGTIIYGEVLNWGSGPKILNIIDALCIDGEYIANLGFQARREKCVACLKRWNHSDSRSWWIVCLDTFPMDELSVALSRINDVEGIYSIDPSRVLHSDWVPLSFQVKEILFLKVELSSEKSVASFRSVMGNRLCWKWPKNFDLGAAAKIIQRKESPYLLLEYMRKNSAYNS